MRILIVLAAVLVASGCTTVIRNDPGGRVIEYALKVQRAEAVKVDGWCASACTLYLAHPRLCITRRARFAFHAATHPKATQYLISQYPAWVNRWIAVNGGLTADLIEMPNAYAMKHVRQCA